jgi:ABC-type polysaccharide/polyol phosphate export permease
MTTYSRAAQSSAELTTPASRLAEALIDLAGGLLRWRVWWVLALNDIRQRYRRSTLGQFWLTISMAVSITGVGLVFGLIFNHPLDSYVPFLGIGFIIWNLLSGMINELATRLIGADTYLRSYPAPRSVIIYRTITRNLLVTAHNLLLVPTC